MKRALLISMIAVTFFALTLVALAQSRSPRQFPRSDDSSSSNRRDQMQADRVKTAFAEQSASRAQPAAYAEAKKIMLAEAARRKAAGEKAPSFAGYELGMIQSDLDKKAAARQEDASPGKELVVDAERRGRREVMANKYRTTTSLHLDAEKKYRTNLELIGDGIIIVQINVRVSAPSMQIPDAIRYAVAVVEQKTGRKPDIIKEDGLYAKWNAKTYEAEVRRVSGVPGVGPIEIMVKTKTDHDSRTVKPGI